MTEQIYMLDNLSRLKQHLAKHNKIYQINRDSQGEVGWSEAGTEDAAPLYGPDYLPVTSPKGFFFAENEQMYRFDGTTFCALTPDVSPFVLFGVQACDLTAISYQDTFFKQDPYYQARRQRSLLVGIDCDKPCASGFCPQVDAGPQVAQAHADIILCQLVVEPPELTSSAEQQPRSWLLIVSSEKGATSLQGLDLQPAPASWLTARAQMADRLLAKFANADYIHASIEVINQAAVPAKLWEELSVRCLSCSGCTNLCPTCSCYSTYEHHDAASNTHTTRRIWDSCQFEGFQREASSHNPSQLAAQRTERFWFHKFAKDYLAEFGRFGCVGCGRCEQTCPGTIGVHTVMKRIQQACCN